MSESFVPRLLRPRALIAAAALLLAGLAPSSTQVAPESAMRETLAIGEEPGRVSTDEVVITDGPYKRQVVFFRSNKAPGTS